MKRVLILFLFLFISSSIFTEDNQVAPMDLFQEDQEGMIALMQIEQPEDLDDEVRMLLEQNQDESFAIIFRLRSLMISQKEDLSMDLD